MAKRVILAVPYLYGLDQCIEKNLRHLGYDVINLCYDNRDSYYPSPFHRIISTFYRKVRKDENYKKLMQYSRYQADIDSKLAVLNGKKADIALCIRANVYPKEIIRKIREHSNYCVNYQWDGINAHPDILEYLVYFDRFFVFDHSDIEKYPSCHFEPSHNFYFDYPVKDNPLVTNGVYFLGGHQDSRVNEIQHFLDEVLKLKLTIDFYIVSKGDRAKNAFNHNPYIHYVDSQHPLTFEDNLYKVRENAVVVDFLNNVHQGLSFRAFDALCFNKKLITNNQTISNYDFYHPNNIFIWNGKNATELMSFLTLPYVPVADEIKEKYSFTGWLKQILPSE